MLFLVVTEMASRVVMTVDPGTDHGGLVRPIRWSPRVQQPIGRAPPSHAKLCAPTSDVRLFGRDNVSDFEEA